MENDLATETRGSYYRYQKHDQAAIAEVCAWAIDEATSAEELASVARLVAVVGLADELAPVLKGKLLDRMKAHYAENRASEALADARWIAAGLESLSQGVAILP